jgi:DNA-3-methyladenine glycosylase I
MDFDPVAVAELNDKKLTAPGTAAISLLSEVKIRSILDNSRHVRKVTEHKLTLTDHNY